MSMPTPSQRVWILVHTAWDMLDQGLPEEQLLRQLTGAGAPDAIAREALRIGLAERAKLPHSDLSYRDIASRLEEAVVREDYEAIPSIVAETLQNKRLLHKIYAKLAELLVSPTHSVGSAAAYGLSLLPGYGDWPLIQALENKEEMVRYRAAFALGKMGRYGNDAIPALTKALSDPDDWVRDAASEALKAIQKDK